MCISDFFSGARINNMIPIGNQSDERRSINYTRSRETETPDLLGETVG